MQLEQKNSDISVNCNAKSATILIVEDDELNSFFLEEVLKGHSNKLLKAINGQDAVDLCYKHPEIDLVLMDIRMPVLNGIEATQQIKSFRMFLPIIAVTAYALDGDEDLCIESGCDGYISKPINREKLLRMVEKYLSYKTEKTLEIC